MKKVFLRAYLTIPYAKISFTFCEGYDSLGPKCRDSFFYNHPVFPRITSLLTCLSRCIIFQALTDTA